MPALEITTVPKLIRWQMDINFWFGMLFYYYHGTEETRLPSASAIIKASFFNQIHNRTAKISHNLELSHFGQSPHS